MYGGMVSSHSSTERPPRSHRMTPELRRTVSSIQPASPAGSSTATPQKDNRSVYKKMLGLVKQAWLGMRDALAENDEVEYEEGSPPYKPTHIDSLCRSTRFTRSELQLLYRRYKQACPAGSVSAELFREVFTKFFPQGDATKYAQYLFNTFGHDENGGISFTDFIRVLSVITRGTVQDRLRWTFQLYDVNRDGYITKDEMLDVVSSVYSLMGKWTEPGVDDNTAKRHVDRVFQELDLNRDGVVTEDEFLESCSKDDRVNKSICIFEDLCY